MPQQQKPPAPAKDAPAASLGPADYIVRGIIAGGSVGALGALLGFSRSLFFGIGLGMIAGCLAGLTLARRRLKKK
jgi:hypothetical protein